MTKLQQRTVLLSLLALLPVGALLVLGHDSARADAPAGRYTNLATVADCGGTPCVKDNKTGLVWKKTEESGGPFTLTAAAAKCTSPWRMPTIRELESLVDETKTAAPTIDTTFFPGATGAEIWSGSPFAGTPGNTWFVTFANGASAADDASKTYGVRCVR